MSGLETAIRNALSRSERGDATIRARIYQTARQALEAGLTRQAVTDPDVIAAERQRLELKIREIESEERERATGLSQSAPHVRVQEPPVSPAPTPQSPASPASASRAPVQPSFPPEISAVSPDAPAASRPRRVDPVMAPTVAPQDRSASDTPGDARRSEPSLDDAMRAPESHAAEPAPSSESGFADLGGMRAERRDDRLAPPPVPERKGRQAKVKPARGGKGNTHAASGLSDGDAAPGIPGEKRKRRRRGLISRLFIWLIMLTFIVMGGWWAWTSGLFLTAAQRDTSVPNPPATVSEEDFSGTPAGTPAGFDPQHGFSADWLEVYGPDRKAAVSAGASATVETVAMADGPALRITSASADESGDVAIEVPVDILRELSGKTSTIALTLQSAADRSVQVAVRCGFASLGNCSRHRVAASQERADTLFRVTFDRTLAPTQPGRIYINSDILGGRSPIFLYSVRVLPGQ